MLSLLCVWQIWPIRYQGNLFLKSFLNNSVFKISGDNYLGLLIIIAPLLNLLSGFTYDLYTPSMPAIATYFSASLTEVKNTVTFTLIGISLGCLVFGVLLDVFGRRRIILLGLLLYTLASFAAIFCHTIEQLFIVRFLQGMMVAVASIGSRSIIIDTFTGHRFNIALMYTSLAYGLGPIIAPFIGGVLQYYFGWQANFLVYALLSVILMLMVIAYINESIPQCQPFVLKNIISNYKMVLRHPVFFAAILIGGFSQILLMIYTTVGAFIVENILHYTAITFGNTALFTGCFYLMGTLNNRIVIKKFTFNQLTHFGFILMSIGCLLQILCAIFASLNLWTMLLPIGIISYSQGFVYPNVLARCLQIFPKNAGVATSTQSCFLVAIAGFATFIISHINVTNLVNLMLIFVIVIVLQVSVFYFLFKPKELKLSRPQS